MSSPYGGFSDDHQDREQADRPRGGEGGPAPDHPGYPPTPHPEDSASYAHPGYGMGYGQGYGQGYGDWLPGHGQPRPQAAGLEQGSGHIDVMRAISWGFRQAYRNWRVWILGVAALLAISIVGGIVSGALTSPGAEPAGAVLGAGVNFLISLVMVALGVFALRGVLHQVDDPDMGWGHFGRDVNFWPTLLLQLILGMVTSALLAVTVGSVLAGFADQFADPTAIASATESEIMAAAGSLLTAVALVLLAMVLINPLVVFMPYYLVERRADFLGSIGQGLRAGARNYLRLLVTYVVAGILVFAAVVMTFGLAAIFLVGPWFLAQGHMYRQAAGGAVPAQ